MNSKHVFALILIIQFLVALVMYLVTVSGSFAKSTDSGSFPVISTSITLEKSVTQDTPNQTFDKVADHFGFGKTLLDRGSFDKSKSEHTTSISVDIECEADHNINFSTVDDESGKLFDKLMTRMAADMMNNNFSRALENLKNASLVMQVTFPLPVTSEKNAICASHCNPFDENCKFTGLGYNAEDLSSRFRVSTLTLNVSRKMIQCSGYSDYFRAKDAHIDIMTWEGKIIRSNAIRYLKKGKVHIYGLFDWDNMLNAKGVRCTLQFQQYRNRENLMDSYIFVCLVTSSFLCIAYCCCFERILQVLCMNDMKTPLEDIEGGKSKMKGGGVKGSQQGGQAKITSLELIETQNYWDLKVILKQPPPFLSTVMGNKVHVKIDGEKSNETQAIPLKMAQSLIENEKGEIAGGKSEHSSVGVKRAE